MLSSVRKFTKGPIGWIVLSIIFIPFIFFGIQSYFINTGNKIAIRVGDESISNLEFDNLWQQQLRKYQGQNLSDQTLNLRRLNLIRSEVSRLTIAHYLKTEKYNVSNQLIGRNITSNPTFFLNKKFSKQKYLALLKQNQIALDTYENGIRNNLKINQFSFFINHALFSNSSELNQISKIISQKRTGGYQVFDTSELTNQVQLSEQEIEKRYTQNLFRYKNPEKTKIDYLLINKNNLKVSSVTQSEIKKYYQNSEVRSVREIFISNKSDIKQKNKVKEKLANEIYFKIKNNQASFDSLLTYSDNLKSLGKKGSLGLIEKNTQGPKFDEVVFNLKVNEVGLLKTNLGYRILLVAKIINYKNKDLVKVQEQIKTILTKQKKTSKYRELVNTAKKINYDNFASLAALALTLKEYGIKIQRSGYFDFSGNNLNKELNFPQLIKEAFSRKLKVGSNSSVIKLTENKSIIFRLKDYLASNQKTFEQAKPEITRRLKLEKAISQLKNKLDKKIATLGAQQEASSLFDHWQSFSQLDLAEMTDHKINLEIAQSIFNLKIPNSKLKINLKTVILSNNQIAVIGLSSIKLKTEQQLNAKDLTLASNIFKLVINQAILSASINLWGEQYGVFVDKSLFDFFKKK